MSNLKQNKESIKNITDFDLLSFKMPEIRLVRLDKELASTTNVTNTKTTTSTRQRPKSKETKAKPRSDSKSRKQSSSRSPSRNQKKTIESNKLGAKLYTKNDLVESSKQTGQGDGSVQLILQHAAANKRTTRSSSSLDNKLNSIIKAEASDVIEFVEKKIETIEPIVEKEILTVAEEDSAILTLRRSTRRRTTPSETKKQIESNLNSSTESVHERNESLEEEENLLRLSEEENDKKSIEKSCFIYSGYLKFSCAQVIRLALVTFLMIVVLGVVNHYDFVREIQTNLSNFSNQVQQFAAQFKQRFHSLSSQFVDGLKSQFNS